MVNTHIKVSPNYYKPVVLPSVVSNIFSLKSGDPSSSTAHISKLKILVFIRNGRCRCSTFFENPNNGTWQKEEQSLCHIADTDVVFFHDKNQFSTILKISMLTLDGWNQLSNIVKVLVMTLGGCVHFLFHFRSLGYIE
jgi:hypothetical protein